MIHQENFHLLDRLSYDININELQAYYIPLQPMTVLKHYNRVHFCNNVGTCTVLLAILYTKVHIYIYIIRS